MTQPPDDDSDLINFLCQHRPEVPPASPDLEQQILQQVKACPLPPLRHYSRLRLVLPALAAGLVAAIVGYRAFIPVQPSPAELATLQNFIESNWQDTVSNEHLESDVWHFTDLDTE
ncbi:MULTISPECIES: hypothetical protein [unclassified Nostoc]|uniref:hypothetical protein n=1 Tax=unclassified Nostoc TaxID=2593658 RepID=UPI000B9577C6|nr:hypothetical protein [Nostoc sp. 'Peltigera membranacea cyanobiont' 232]OYE02363.1 hypothetical protein CDG79_24470 [Nostoc sp. 'Peltigera membranacea cyanobiont' 232]